MSIEYISLLIDNKSVVNGFGKSVKASDTILQWAKDLKEFKSHVEAGVFPDGYTLMVPDFWHIAYGDAKCLPKEDADTLWQSSVDAREIATPYIQETEMVIKPHPGTKLHLKKIVP